VASVVPTSAVILSVSKLVLSAVPLPDVEATNGALNVGVIPGSNKAMIIVAGYAFLGP
jgi:hypothetical protein